MSKKSEQPQPEQKQQPERTDFGRRDWKDQPPYFDPKPVEAPKKQQPPETVVYAALQAAVEVVRAHTPGDPSPHFTHYTETARQLEQTIAYFNTNVVVPQRKVQNG